MANKNQIYAFAMKWIDKFRDPKINYIELVDHYMADDCAALGFEMDCGHAFGEAYGNAGNNAEALDRIIDDVTDIPLLGSAIYSQWRYFNHWAYDGVEILEPKNRSWFIVALGRLASLTGNNPFLFRGKLKKMRIVSDAIGYGTPPELEDEVEQHLTINSEGRIWFSAYAFGAGFGKYTKTRSKNYSIEKNAATEVLNKVVAYFSEGYDEIAATDIGDWVMELTNTEGETYKFRGSLCADFEIDGVDLSDLVRDTLDMQDLYVFDGNNKPDKINRIVLDYHRVTKIKPKEVPEGATWEFVTWDYTEQLSIDRKTETIEHIQNIGTDCKVSRKYEIEGGIESLLNDLDAEDLFGNIVGNSDDFEEFADTVFDFMRFYGLGEILDPSVYDKVKRRNTDYIFCSIVFDEGPKSYYYLTEDDSIEVGDFVLVPAGKDNHEATVKVVDIEYFAEGATPLPVEKTKQIIRKCTDIVSI